MEDLRDHPFAVHMATESYESPAERDWLRWVKKVERLLGHDLDGHQDRDGYSLDYAYSAWEAGATPAAHAEEIRLEKTIKNRSAT